MTDWKAAGAAAFLKIMDDDDSFLGHLESRSQAELERIAEAARILNSAAAGAARLQQIHDRRADNREQRARLGAPTAVEIDEASTNRAPVGRVWADAEPEARGQQAHRTPGAVAPGATT